MILKFVYDVYNGVGTEEDTKRIMDREIRVIPNIKEYILTNYSIKFTTIDGNEETIELDDNITEDNDTYVSILKEIYFMNDQGQTIERIK